MSWAPASFRGNRVWAKVDDAGQPAATGGRVEIRYSEAPDATIYRAAVGNVAVDGPAIALPAGVSADDKDQVKASRSSGFGSAGTRTAAQAAAAAADARQRIAGLPAGSIVAYTDGSCRGNPGTAGSGAVVELPDGRTIEASKALGVATNNIAELTAVGLALDLLDRAGVPPDAPAVVHTDSKYADGVLCRGWKVKANTELVAALRGRLAARPGVRLQWLAGHVGVAGNERADALANRGVDGVTAEETRPPPAR